MKDYNFNYEQAIKMTLSIMIGRRYCDEETSYVVFSTKWYNGERADSATLADWGYYALVATPKGFIPLPLAKKLLSKEDYREVVRNWIKAGGTASELVAITK